MVRDSRRDSLCGVDAVHRGPFVCGKGFKLTAEDNAGGDTPFHSAAAVQCLRHSVLCGITPDLVVSACRSGPVVIVADAAGHCVYEILGKSGACEVIVFGD